MKDLSFSSYFTTFLVLNLIIITISSYPANSSEADEDLERIIEYIDITHKITPELPAGGSKAKTGIGEFIWLVKSMKNGSLSNNSDFKLNAHTGTHIDAPSHFYQNYYDQGIDITSLDLSVLHGRVLVVDAPRDKNITREALESLYIPKNVRRVLFRTLNTDRKLMHKKEYERNFTGFTADGAEWLVRNTNIRLVGVDYLSVAAYTDHVPVHLTLLKNKRVIIVEGLNLDDAAPGYYDLQCLPLRMVRAEASPARCILMRTIRSRR